MLRVLGYDNCHRFALIVLLRKIALLVLPRGKTTDRGEEMGLGRRDEDRTAARAQGLIKSEG